MKYLTMIASILITAAVHASSTLTTVEYISGYVVSADGYEVSPQTDTYQVGVEVVSTEGVCERNEYKLIELKKIQLEYGEMYLPTISVNKSSAPCA